MTANLEVGNQMGVTAAPPSVKFNADTHLMSIADMDTRLAAINGTLYNAAMLALMSRNDKVYAIRLADYPTSIKQ